MSDTNAMRARIQAELHDRTDLSQAINRSINDAIKHYESTRFRWNEFTETTIASTASGTQDYSLPGGFVSFDFLKVDYNGSWVPIRPWTWEEMSEADRDSDDSITGLPTRYAVRGNIVRLFPIPNGAYSLVGSGIQRLGLTSLTGSYCGSMTLTPTSTASHNNRLNGWFTDGEELIRARAKALVKINYLEDERALLEAGAITSRGRHFLSMMEMQAYERLADETSDALSSGRIKPYFI